MTTLVKLGRKVIITNIYNSLGYYIPSISGANLTTTIDISLQIILEKYLQEALLEHKAKGVTGIILDVSNGNVLAMSNLPDFDLNNVPRDDLNQLFSISKNKSVVDVYEPGSTFKIITMAAALNEGLTNVEERFYCGGSCSVDGERIKCWRTIGHGSQTLVEGFKNSCNCVFVQLALRLGVNKLYEYMDLFGVGQKTGVDIASESSGIVMNQNLVKNVDLARIGFGQSVAVTSLQLTNIFGFITSGKSYTPHIINIYTQDTMLYTYTPTAKSTRLKAETVSTINMMLANNINSEGKYTFVAGYDVGGKTGTAQKFANGVIAQGKYVSSFIGVYPTKNPKYVVFISVDEPSNGAYYGGVVAKPIGQKVFDEMFKIKNISPDDASQLINQPTIIMPNVIGLTVAQACAKLKQLNLNVNLDGMGGYIVSQLPLENTLLYEGEEVLLVTSD